MPKRLSILAALLGAALMLLAALPAASASATEPWWQVLTGSRPTNMWEATDNVQEITTQTSEFFGEQATAGGILVNGEVVGCIGTENFVGTILCEGFLGGFPPEASAPQLEATLKAAFDTSDVEVTGGPVGGEPFRITVAHHGAPAISIRHMRDVNPEFPEVGSVESKQLSAGGSGRLVLTLTNLGDAPIDGSDTPVKILDELPEGAQATSVETFVSADNTRNLVECTLAEAGDVVSCEFKSTLRSFESIEIEIFVSLLGEPPHAGASGTVSVSGGNAPAGSASQPLEISPQETPFGVERFSAKPEEEGGLVASRAGAHPFQLTTTVQLNSGPAIPGRAERTDVVQPALPRNLRFPLPSGLVGNATAVATCPVARFFHKNPAFSDFTNECTPETTVGAASVASYQPGILGLKRVAVPVFNLPPAFGEPARFGFYVLGVPVMIDTSVDSEHGYRIIAHVDNTTQLAKLLSSTVTLWGSPGDPRHDGARGWGCIYYHSVGPCERPQSLQRTAFLRMPVSCAAPLDFSMDVEPWNVPAGSVLDSAAYSSGFLHSCNQVPFSPSINAAPTSKLAETPSGLDFRLDMPNSDLLSSKDKAIAEGQPKKVEVTLPEGMTINPSEGEGLVGCTEAEYARETAESRPGEGCPDASKVGTIDIATPLLEEEAHGALYVAAPYANPTGSLIALYMVAKIPDRGIVVKQAGKVEADPVTGQLTTTFDDLPQLPYSTFHLHFREGGRAPLVTPPACGSYDVTARFTPWSAADPNNPAPNEVVEKTSSFTIEHGVDGGACPAGGLPPFRPGLLAGTINNAAGSYSPFNVRLTRTDGEQEFTHFSIKLPPGVVGKLAGIPLCPDAAIAAAKARTGSHGGQEELENPSCPAASQVGRTLVGAGVGNSLTYVPGKVYLAGPYHGAPISIVAITSAKVGPFDLGTVVVREALKVNPETAEVFVDATGSDPIPHIIQGVPVHARDIRVYVDRPDFVLNPTSCERTSTASTVLGSGLDFASEADDNPITVTSPFQAADCAALGFHPTLKLRLRGGTKRGAFPALRAELRQRPGEASIARARVTLPHSEFLEQGHIGTVCTRVQFAAGAGDGTSCPAASVYGRARAWTPLLSEPLEGPVFLRSNPEHELPDLVAALHGSEINIDLVGHVEGVKGGMIRNTFEAVPDAPVSKFVLEMRGGKKSLLVNSTDICAGTHRAAVNFNAHNGKRDDFRPALQAKCKKARRKAHGKHHHRHHRHH